MKGNKWFRLLLCLVLALGMACPAFAEGVSGTATASAAGFGGAVEVTLTMENGKITDVKIVGDNETEGVGSRAIAEMPEAMLKAGSISVDGVTGATVTSDAILTAADLALKQLNGETYEVHMKPGTYLAEGRGFNNAELLPVKVTVSETEILAIEKADEDDTCETEVIVDTVWKNLVPRMIENQSVAVDSITGATMSSNAVKQATEKALAEALKEGGSDPAAISAFYKAPVKENEGKVVEENVDVVVVGLGSAGVLGMTSAMETLQAANPGEPVSILGIEKTARVGGQSTMAHEPFAVNPPKFQEEFNNGENYIDVDKLRETWLEYTTDEQGRQRAKPEMIDLMIEESGKTIDWLKYDHDFIFAHPRAATFSVYDFVCGYNYYDIDISYELRRAQVSGWMQRLVDEVVEAGGSYLLETEGYELLADEEGNICGVKARNLVDGTEYIIHAKSVLMATGGYGGNSDMMHDLMVNEYYDLQSYDWKLIGFYSNDGKIFQSALDHGAGTWNIGMMPISLEEFGAPEEMHIFDVNYIEGQITNRTGRTSTWSLNDIPVGMLGSADILTVDRKGNRMGNEFGNSMDMGELLAPMALKSGSHYFAIYDSSALEDLRVNGITTVQLWPGYVGQGGVPDGMPLGENLDIALEEAMKMGYAYKADTIEELAEQIGMDGETLKATLDRYNELCELGEDKDFGKDPKFLKKLEEGPFYAITGYPYIFGSCGGLDVDTELRVLKDDHTTALNGLYAAGGDSTGVLFSDEKNYIGFGGVNLGWVITSGRLGGISAAEYALTQK